MPCHSARRRRRCARRGGPLRPGRHAYRSGAGVRPPAATITISCARQRARPAAAGDRHRARCWRTSSRGCGCRRCISLPTRSTTWSPGTGNRSELMSATSPSTATAAVDLLPLGRLLKSEVRDLGARTRRPAAIIDKPPSAGLWAGRPTRRRWDSRIHGSGTYLMQGPEAVPRAGHAHRAPGASQRAQTRPRPLSRVTEAHPEPTEQPEHTASNPESPESPSRSQSQSPVLSRAPSRPRIPSPASRVPGPESRIPNPQSSPQPYPTPIPSRWEPGPATCSAPGRGADGLPAASRTAAAAEH